MWKLSLFLFLYFNLTLCAWTSVRPEGGVYKWQNSFRAPFGSTRVAFWEGSGRAQVEERGVRLTTNEPNTIGTWFNTKPLLDKEWELRLSFVIGSEHNQGGKGIVLWVVNQKPSEGDFYGFSSTWNGLALVFDTERDNPIIYAVKNENSFNFEGDLEQHSLGSCSANLRQLTSSVDKVTSLLIRYKDQQLLVSHDLSSYSDAEYGWTDCFNVPFALSPNEEYFLGLSASTGLNADNHFVNMLTTWGLDKKTPQSNYQQNQQQGQQEVQKQQNSNQQNQDQQAQNQDQQVQDQQAQQEVQQQTQDQQDQQIQDQQAQQEVQQQTQDQQDQNQQAQNQQAQDQQVNNQQYQQNNQQTQIPYQQQYQQTQQNQNLNQEQNGIQEKINNRFTDLEQLHDEYSQKFNTKTEELESRIKRYSETVNTQRVRLGDLARNSKQDDSGTELDRGVKFLASEIEKLNQALTRLEDTINSKHRDTEWLAGNQENLGERLKMSASGSGYSMWPVLIGIQVLAILIYIACKGKEKHSLHRFT